MTVLHFKLTIPGSNTILYLAVIPVDSLFRDVNMKIKKLKYYLSILLLGFVLQLRSDNVLTVNDAQFILDSLYHYAGQYVYTKPQIQLSESNQRVAAYIPAKNLITIDPKALDICNSMGKESFNSLAFLIGHELTHAFQKEVRTNGHATHFLSYDKHIHGSIRTEKVADIQGVFTAYLAGYGLQDAVPTLLDKIYTDYQLKGKKLSNYPSYDERLKSAKEVVELVEELIDLFEANQYLLALGKHKIAAISLEHILEYYEGYEIQNNLGVTYTHAAMEFFDHQTDLYAYPLELDGATQLSKIDRSRGPALNFMELTARQNILEQALSYFRKAVHLNRNYTIGKINIACTLNLLRKPEAALRYLQGTSFSKKEKNSDAYQLTIGITKALLNHKAAPAKQFKQLINSSRPTIAAMAAYNAAVGATSDQKKSRKEATLPQILIDRTEKLTLGSTRSWPETQLGQEEQIYFKKNKANRKSAFCFGKGFNNLISLLIMPIETDKAIMMPLNKEFYHNMVTTKEYYYIKSDTHQLVLKCNKKGKVVEVVKYFDH